MNGLEQRFRTFGQLMTEVKTRLGFITMGPASNNNNPIISSFLSEAHEYVYAQLEPSAYVKRGEVALETGSRLYDYHNDADDEIIDPGLVQTVWIADGVDRYRLTQGITEMDRADINRAMPSRYDTLNGQIEVSPTPDKAYTLVIEYLAPKPRFTQDQDRPGVDDRLIFMYALALAKAHYRHPDAQAYASTFNQRLRIEKTRQHENRRYIVNDRPRTNETVTGSDGHYTMKVN